MPVRSRLAQNSSGKGLSLSSREALRRRYARIPTLYVQDAYATASEYEQKFEKHEKEHQQQIAQKDGAIAERDKQIAELTARVSLDRTRVGSVRRYSACAV